MDAVVKYPWEGSSAGDAPARCLVCGWDAEAVDAPVVHVTGGDGTPVLMRAACLEQVIPRLYAAIQEAWARLDPQERGRRLAAEA